MRNLDKVIDQGDIGPVPVRQQIIQVSPGNLRSKSHRRVEHGVVSVYQGCRGECRCIVILDTDQPGNVLQVSAVDEISAVGNDRQGANTSGVQLLQRRFIFMHVD